MNPEHPIKDKKGIGAQHVDLTVGKIQYFGAPQDDLDTQNNEHIKHAQTQAIQHKLYKQLYCHNLQRLPSFPLG